MQDISPLYISLKVAVCATMITLILGVGMAKLVTDMRRGRFVFDTILSLPLVLPPTVVGFFLLILFGNNSVIGRALNTVGVNVIFNIKGAVIAAVVVSFPVMYRTARGAFEQVDTELVDAARTLGFGKYSIFFRVWLPLAWHGIVSGAVLAFARALGEFGATIMIAGNLPGRTRTMSIAVYTAMQSGNREQAYRWVVIVLVLSFVILLGINLWTGKRYTKE